MKYIRSLSSSILRRRSVDTKTSPRRVKSICRRCRSALEPMVPSALTRQSSGISNSDAFCWLTIQSTSEERSGALHVPIEKSSSMCGRGVGDIVAKHCDFSGDVYFGHEVEVRELFGRPDVASGEKPSGSVSRSAA